MKELLKVVAAKHAEAFHKDLHNKFQLGMSIAYGNIILDMAELHPELEKDSECAAIIDRVKRGYPAV